MGHGRERAWAAVAHLAVLLGDPGLLVSGALWLYARRRRLAFAGGQAGQAVAYQAFLGTLMIALRIVGAQALLRGLGVGVVHLAGMAYGAFAAFAALDGRFFRYARGR